MAAISDRLPPVSLPVARPGVRAPGFSPGEGGGDRQGGRRVVGVAAVAHQAPEEAGGVLIVAGLVLEVRERHRPVEGRQPALRADRQVEPGEVGVADDDLGVLAQRLVIDAVEDPGEAVAAPDREHGAGVGVAQGLVQLGDALVVGPGEVAALPVDPLGDDDLEALGLEQLLRAADAVHVAGAGGRDEPDDVAGAEGAGLRPAFIGEGGGRQGGGDQAEQGGAGGGHGGSDRFRRGSACVRGGSR